MPTMDYQVEHQENGDQGAFYVQIEGHRRAEMVYTRVHLSVIRINHTEVDKSLAGQGIGRKLLDELVRWARATGTKVLVACPFARAQFDKDPSIRDVLT